MIPRLSICIPIYNCADYIGQALDSILPQAKDGVEVVVFDGGSTDGTESLLSEYAANWRNLTYHRAAQKGGIDADLATCVDLSSGDYCWLFSGDDVMRPGAIQKAIDQISRGYDAYICEHTICDKTMRVLREYPVFAPDIPIHGDLSNREFRESWFQRAQSTEAFFRFMSSLVIRRQKWQAGRMIPEFSRSCWAHVARFFDLIPSGLRVCYVPEIWLDQRGGNDSFLHGGLVKRYEIAIDGYDRLAAKFFGEQSLERREISRVLRREFTLRMFLLAKLYCWEDPDKESKEKLNGLVGRSHGGQSAYDRTVRFAYWATPVFAVRIARYFWIRSHKNSSLQKST